MTSDRDEMPGLLAIALGAGVPLRLAELAVMMPEVRDRTIAEWASAAADVVASRGDQLMFRTKPHKGEGGTADTFNHLARGLAALAHAPGGVRFMGTHWCSAPPCPNCAPRLDGPGTGD